MEITDFCKSLDFMKLGQAINHNNWRAASSVLQRMQKQCLLHRDQLAAKNALAGVIARRTQILNLRNQDGREGNGEKI